MHGHEKSDPAIVAVKPANKTEQAAAERSVVEPTAAEHPGRFVSLFSASLRCGAFFWAAADVACRCGVRQFIKLPGG